MSVEIVPGSLRDISFIAANMREQDRREIFATAMLGSATDAAAISFYGSGPDWSWTAWLDGQPVGAFGVGRGSPLQPHIRHAWAYGTGRFRRVVPAITRFVRSEWPDRLFIEGVTRLEARSISDHDVAHRWLAGLGAKREAEMRGYGVNGETFELWAFLKEDFDDVLHTTARTRCAPRAERGIAGGKEPARERDCTGTAAAGAGCHGADAAE